MDLGPLEYVYSPSSDVAADVRWFETVLGAEVRFAIDDSGVRVAMLRLGVDSPPMLLTDHLPDARPVFIYRVDSLAEASATLRGRGFDPDTTIELPMGPAATFHAPGGLRLGIVELTRAFVVERMVGRRDF